MNNEDTSVCIFSPINVTDPFQQTHGRVTLSKGDLAGTYSLPLQLVVQEDDLVGRGK